MISRAAFVFCIIAGSTAAASPEHHWSSGFSSPRLRVDAIAADPSGHVVIVGYADYYTNLGSGPLGSAGPDVFVAKFDPFGSLLWSRMFNGSHSNQHARSVAFDNQGNTMIVGDFTGTIDFGGAPMSASGLSIFVTKLDADGNHLWSKHFGNTGPQLVGNYGEDVAIDVADNVFVTGSCSGSIDFGEGVLQGLGVQAMFLAKYDSAGNHVWSQRFWSTRSQSGKQVAVDGAGNIVVAGVFRGALFFDGSYWIDTPGEDIFVARVDADGSHVWVRKFGDESTQSFTSMAVDAVGNLFAAGEFIGWIDFGGGVLTSPPNDVDGYVVSLDATGAHRWNVQIGGAQPQTVRALALDPVGNVDITGAFEGLLDVGGVARASAGLGDVFVARLDPSGAFTWAESFGGTGADLPAGVAVDGEGNLALTGAFGDAIDFGGDPLWGSGSSNVYLARLGEGSIEPVLNLSVNSRGHAVETRWDISSRRPLDRFIVLRDNAFRTAPTIVAMGPVGPGQGTHVDQDVVAGETYQYELIAMTPAAVEYRAPIVTVTVPAFANHLAQNSPNPFNPRTSIPFSLAERSSITIDVFDVRGALVRRIGGGTREPGEYVVEWDGRDETGNAVGSGVYFYRLDGVNGVAPRKMVLLK
jgi:FlgD Ig-like domain